MKPKKTTPKRLLDMGLEQIPVAIQWWKVFHRDEAAIIAMVVNVEALEMGPRLGKWAA